MGPGATYPESRRGGGAVPKNTSVLWGLSVICATAFAVLWMAFGDACSGVICGVAPAYFLVFLMALMAVVEVLVTVVWTFLRLTNSPPSL